MQRALVHAEWVTLRTLLKHKSLVTGDTLRRVQMWREPKYSGLLGQMVAFGLLKATAGEPLNAEYALTDAGRVAADTGYFDWASPPIEPRAHDKKSKTRNGRGK